MHAGVFAYPPPYGVASPCGTDWATACATLSDAIAQALSGAPATAQVWAGPGEYHGTQAHSEQICKGSCAIKALTVHVEKPEECVVQVKA